MTSIYDRRLRKLKGRVGYFVFSKNTIIIFWKYQSGGRWLGEHVVYGTRLLKQNTWLGWRFCVANIPALYMAQDFSSAARHNEPARILIGFVRLSICSCPSTPAVLLLVAINDPHLIYYFIREKNYLFRNNEWNDVRIINIPQCGIDFLQLCLFALNFNLQ